MAFMFGFSEQKYTDSLSKNAREIRPYSHCLEVFWFICNPWLEARFQQDFEGAPFCENHVCLTQKANALLRAK